MRRLFGLLATLVAAALVLTGCSVYSVPLPGGASVGGKPITLHIKFRDVLDLVPQSSVKVDDVTVGKVTSIKLDGYVADVAVQVPHNVKLPENATASIKQTSLLGEKFVALQTPQNPSTQRVHNGETIGLDRTGRDPEVEEVLGALAAILNGGGVAQVKTIANELNTAVGHREGAVRSVLDQIHYFVGQLARSKQQVVTAIENTNRLSAELRRQNGTIKLALNDIPPALRSLNHQRGDLVRTLAALSRLSNVGVRVIQASKVATINSLSDLAPVLDKLAQAGSSFPKSLQIALTYPFINASVGYTPQQGRNLAMGDYVNLSVRVNLDLANLVLPGLPALDLQNLQGLLCTALPPALLPQLCSGQAAASKSTSPLLSGKKTGANKNGLGSTLGHLGLGRTTPDSSFRRHHRAAPPPRGDGSTISRLMLQGAGR